jgi:hypothetical protein
LLHDCNRIITLLPVAFDLITPDFVGRRKFYEDVTRTYRGSDVSFCFRTSGRCSM